MRIGFAKYEGLGNDFLLVDVQDPSAGALTPERVVALCDRHRGVGGDGVIVAGLLDGGPVMRVHNADGSVPEMCGNGIRCVALHLVRSGAVHGPSLQIDTDAGPHACRVNGNGRAASVEVRMRPPSLDPAHVPVTSERPLVDQEVDLDGSPLHITAVSMGNPHAVTFDDVGEGRLAFGPRLERDARFPKGVNVGFARLARQGGIDLHVWERGAGWTRACGTGACAAAVAAVETGRMARGTPIPVHLPGGTLTITVDAPGEPVRMDGPARHVFDGDVDLEGLDA
jgi:diaminopimelate epimerase